jgi:hypothetical protein
LKDRGKVEAAVEAPLELREIAGGVLNHHGLSSRLKRIGNGHLVVEGEAMEAGGHQSVDG